MTQAEKETRAKFKCWHCEEDRPANTKLHWGEWCVCPKCERGLFMEDVMNSKYKS